MNNVVHNKLAFNTLQGHRKGEQKDISLIFFAVYVYSIYYMQLSVITRYPVPTDAVDIVTATYSLTPPFREDPGVKSRMCPPYPQDVVKGD